MARKYEDLTFADDFMFCKILEQDPELCRELLELILDRKLGRLVSVNREKPVEITADGKGVRLFPEKGLHRYTFTSRCREDLSIELGDETEKIFLCTKGGFDDADDVSERMREFLDYIAGEEAKDGFTRKLEAAVREAKLHKRWRKEYMTLLEHYEQEREEGRKEGLAEGRKEGRAEGLKEGHAAERKNTERERARAEAAEMRIRELEAELMKERHMAGKQ